MEQRFVEQRGGVRVARISHFDPLSITGCKALGAEGANIRGSKSGNNTRVACLWLDRIGRGRGGPASFGCFVAVPQAVPAILEAVRKLLQVRDPFLPT